jgi:uncharacterized protein
VKTAAQFVLRVYKRCISPLLPVSCRFVPTCSEYAMEAIELHGVVRGGLMSAARLLRCHPLAKGGCDPVPRETDPHLPKAGRYGAPSVIE